MAAKVPGVRWYVNTDFRGLTPSFWLFLPAMILCDTDPSYDGNFGVGMAFLFGWMPALGYCWIWMLLRRLMYLPRKAYSVSRRDVQVWSAIAVFCLCFPFITPIVYHRPLSLDLDYTLFGAGPLFILSIVMAITAILDLRRRKAEGVGISQALEFLIGKDRPKNAIG